MSKNNEIVLRDKNDNPKKRIWLSTGHKICTKCRLPLKLKPQRSYGTFNTNIIFIGESPGPEIDQEHNYAWACGKSSMLFKKMLEKYGFKRDKVYLTNLVKCYNPGTSAQQITNCQAYLIQEIKCIVPEVIVCASSLAYYNLPDIPEVYQATIIKIYHPSYVNRFSKHKEYEDQWYNIRRIYDMRTKCKFKEYIDNSNINDDSNYKSYGQILHSCNCEQCKYEKKINNKIKGNKAISDYF